MKPAAHRVGWALLASSVLLLGSGCAPTVGSDDWTLEPITWESSSFGDIDVAFAMSIVTPDGEGGFWSGSAGSWLHVGADGDTLAQFTIDADHPLRGVDHTAALSPTTLLVTRGTEGPYAASDLSIVEMDTREFTDVPVKPLAQAGSDPLGTESDDFMFGDVAVRDDHAYVVRYQPKSPPGYLDADILRIDLDTGERELMSSEALTLEDSTQTAPEVPPVDIDLDGDGRIYLATPSYRIVLDADGAELSRTARTATRPVVAAGPNGQVLWWGGAEAPSHTTVVTVGGSGEARELIEQRTTCAELLRADALRITSDSTDDPLPFLCSPNAAAWTGDSWIVAIGGEGDGVLVRLTPPTNFG